MLLKTTSTPYLNTWWSRQSIDIWSSPDFHRRGNKPSAVWRMNLSPFEELSSTPRLFQVPQYRHPPLGSEMDLIVRSIAVSPPPLTLTGKPALSCWGKDSELASSAFPLALLSWFVSIAPSVGAADCGLLSCSEQNWNRLLCGIYCKSLSLLALVFLTTTFF